MGDDEDEVTSTTLRFVMPTHRKHLLKLLLDLEADGYLPGDSVQVLGELTILELCGDEAEHLLDLIDLASHDRRSETLAERRSRVDAQLPLFGGVRHNIDARAAVSEGHWPEPQG